MTKKQKYWYNIVPFIKEELQLEIPILLDPKTGENMKLSKLSKILPVELAKQELNIGKYKKEKLIEIPKKIQDLYETYRSTPLVRAKKLEKALGLKKVKIFFKREDKSPINSYKLNSSYVQAYFANKEGVKEFIGDTGPGNWGMGMAVACKEFGIPATIYMEESNYNLKIDKVDVMKQQGAIVKPIITKQGTIAASISHAMQHVNKDERNKLSLGCLSAYSALHNTVIGMELKDQLNELNIVPDAIIGVVGGGSSFSGLVFPLIEGLRDTTDFIAVESARVPSFTKGTYRYENPDLIGLMPKAKMFTLGNDFVPTSLGASGLNYHGKNPLLSLLVHNNVIKAVAYEPNEVDPVSELFEKTEGIKPAAESCYAIKGAIEKAKEFDGQDKIVVFSLTGNAHKVNLESK